MSIVPVVVTLCGSSRFKEHHEAMQARETLLGRIVIPMGFYHHKDSVPITAEQKKLLDVLHLCKIDLCEEILVINPNGYIGESTTCEIAYAVATHKNVRYLDKVEGDKWMERESHKLGRLVAHFTVNGRTLPERD